MSHTLPAPLDQIEYFSLPAYTGAAGKRLPFSIKILLESVLRHVDENDRCEEAAQLITGWQAQSSQRQPVPFYPARVLLQDLTGVPLVVDLAAMRSAAARAGGDPRAIAPKIPADLVIDHSLQVDFTNTPNALQKNMALEYERNRERYQFLRWAQDAFNNFKVVPPGKGIVHQINLESLATVVAMRQKDGRSVALPDSVFGTDSHTPMINGLGVLGWGVGGIEAIAALLGKPVDLVLPDVLGLELVGKLPERATPTDLTLTIVQRLREEGVVGKFIECFGPGLDDISVPDRAMIANMSPESGATVIYFPVDGQTLAYLRLTGRSPEQIDLVETYCKAQGLFRQPGTQQPDFTKVIRVELDAISTSLAGPLRPQDRLGMPDLKTAFAKDLVKSHQARGFSLRETERLDKILVTLNGEIVTLRHGSVLIAAITSCTNTSNPLVMLSAGLLAQKAQARGLTVNPAVKCSLMPGSRVVTDYLIQAGLLDPLASLGFDLVGYGCGSCIGNSGPLAPEIVSALQEHLLVTASISSGNRNYEGRIHALTRANYLASPPLVVAYAIAGTVDIDLVNEPLGFDHDGEPVYLDDIYPSKAEVSALMQAIQPELFTQIYADLYQGDENWESVYSGTDSALYDWDSQSSYIQEPPYFKSDIRSAANENIEDIRQARVLALLGDSITTDHISPAGSIPPDSPAGVYLQSLGIAPKDFNTYGARRGNDRVLVRGTLANIRLKNKLVDGVEGGFTRIIPGGEVLSIFDAAESYRKDGIPLIIIAGKEYGTGSSRDWAAKGVLLLGVRAVIAESFERIHRSNLVGMGVLPLEFMPGENASTLGLEGTESYDLVGLADLNPQGECQVAATLPDGSSRAFSTRVRIDTSAELRSFKFGGILHEALMNA